MSEVRIVGRMDVVEPGRWDNQYDVVITKLDGTTQKASVYSHKKDGSISRVWPMVTDSQEHGTVMAWTGTAKEVANEWGTTTYHTISFAFKPKDGEMNGNVLEKETPDWSVPTPQQEDAATGGPIVWPSPPVDGVKAYVPQVEKFGGKDDFDWDCEREAEWAIGLLTRDEIETEGLINAAVTLVVTKRRLASELRKA